MQSGNDADNIFQALRKKRYDFNNCISDFFFVNYYDTIRCCKGNNQETTNYWSTPNSSSIFPSRKNFRTRKSDISVLKRI